MQKGIASLENQLTVSQKVKHRKDICIPMFIALFRQDEQPIIHQQCEWIKEDVVHTHNGVLLTIKTNE